MLTRRALIAAIPATAFSKSLTFHTGPTNTVALHRNNHNLVIYGDPLRRIAKADQVLLTHARRDISWSAQHLIDSGATPVVPRDEAHLFSNPRDAWQAIFSTTRLHDYANQSTHFPTLPLTNAKTVSDKDQFQWQGITIDVIATPGFTRGAVSYSFLLDGKRTIATGDLIYPGGKLLDIYSLQDAIPDLKVRGYHGFASRMAELMASLRRVAALNPHQLIPARGPIIDTPQQQIKILLDRLAALYANYMQTDAYRWYFGADNYNARATRILGNTKPSGLPYAESVEKELPTWLRKIDNARLLISQSGEAILIDCGSQRIINQVRTWQTEGVFKKLRAVYITHYHDDHTDFAQAAADQFGAELWSSYEQRDILINPSRYRMPCLTPNPIPGLAPWQDKESRDWHEFRLQNFHFPGQTIYHGALLVEPKAPKAQRVLFVGDSFTPSGVDDYCLLNRNLLHPRKGLLYCLGIIDKIPDAYLVNQHVEPLFRFSTDQLAQLRKSLEARIPILKDLTPFDDANYSIDEQWFRLAPYVQKSSPNKPLTIEATILNHSPVAKDFYIQLHPPAGWPIPKPTKLRVPSGQESTTTITLTPLPSTKGLQTITASIAFDKHDLRHWTEALIEITAG